MKPQCILDVFPQVPWQDGEFTRLPAALQQDVATAARLFGFHCPPGESRALAFFRFIQRSVSR
jgi:hypothetical protein